MTKYLNSIISAVTGPQMTFADRTMLLPIGHVKTVQLLTHETPDFITPTLWPANKISAVGYRIWGKLQECAHCSLIHDVTKSRLIED